MLSGSSFKLRGQIRPQAVSKAVALGVTSAPSRQKNEQYRVLQSLPWPGTGSSNPLPSSGESANFDPGFRTEETKCANYFANAGYASA
jgi:hypothetical protein